MCSPLRFSFAGHYHWVEREAFFFLLVHACVRNGKRGLVSMEETCSGICPIKRDLAKDLGERESILVKNLEREGGEEDEKKSDR